MCPSCQEPIVTGDDATRRLPSDESPATARSISISHDSLDGGRFLAGQVLSSRYRIIDLIGRGGMGEVYRAEDLTLKQAVALKFLPENLTHDEPALERIRQEVRVARQIAHPYVCRVYDIGETDGQNFLCMEFIKGEELASVLKRFGRLPADKAVEISRQICAGLAAAHKQGVIHRDLKPANVMIDGEGNAKITDFGLAAVAEQLSAEEIRSGTPAYMSPEQLAGRDLTTRSDIYSLGLVLYEIFTGKRAYEAASLPELLKLRNSDQSVTSPTSHVSGLDPVIERVIMRCLEKSPEDRPESAIAVAAALPGGDPIAAALAMGETPSPEMVAAAPKVGSLRPIVAAGLVTGTVVVLGLFVWLSGKTFLYRQAPMNNSPEVLRVKARELTRSLGYIDGIDSSEELRRNVDYVPYLKANDHSPERWQRLMTTHPPSYYYWYRQSPQYMMAWQPGPISRFDPPMMVSGMTRIALDMDGKLVEFAAVPPQLETEPRTATKFDWNILFNAAGLDPAKFTSTEPRWVPEVNSDQRAAWTGTLPDAPDIPVRIEAATFDGRPVFFSTVYPWDSAFRQGETVLATGEKVSLYLISAMLLILVGGGVFLARRNYLLGLGDYKGALRVAILVFFCSFVGAALRRHHAPDLIVEIPNLILTISMSLFLAGVIYVVYIALEPFVRRRWPARMISWNRLMANDLRDPLIGRDILIGILIGAVRALLVPLWTVAPTWFGKAGYEPMYLPDMALLSLRGSLDRTIDAVVSGVGAGLILLFLLTLLVAVVRRDRIATAVAWVILAIVPIAFGEYLWIDIWFGLLGAALMLFCITRIGLLASVMMFGITEWMYETPFTTDLSVWYAGYAFPGYILVAFLLIYGYRTATAGKSLFSGDLIPAR